MLLSDADGFGAVALGASGGGVSWPAGKQPRCKCDRQAAARRGVLLSSGHTLLPALQPRNYHLVEQHELMAPFT